MNPAAKGIRGTVASKGLSPLQRLPFALGRPPFALQGPVFPLQGPPFPLQGPPFPLLGHLPCLIVG